MILLPQIFLDHVDKGRFCFDRKLISHFLLLPKRKTRTDGRYRNIIAFGQLSSETGLSGKNLDLDAITVHSAEFSRISIVNIMEVNSSTRLAEFSIGFRPFACSLKIPFEGFVSFVIP